MNRNPYIWKGANERRVVWCVFGFERASSQKVENTKSKHQQMDNKMKQSFMPARKKYVLKNGSFHLFVSSYEWTIHWNQLSLPVPFQPMVRLLNEQVLCDCHFLVDSIYSMEIDTRMLSNCVRDGDLSSYMLKYRQRFQASKWQEIECMYDIRRRLMFDHRINTLNG